MRGEERRQIRLKNMKFYGRHGVYPEEREEGRLFRADVRIELGPLPGFRTDRIEDTLDYTRCAAAVVEIGTGESVHLLEHLCERMVERLLRFDGVERVDVTVKKHTGGIAGQPDWVSVRVARGRAR